MAIQVDTEHHPILDTLPAELEVKEEVSTSLPPEHEEPHVEPS